jgi:predicted MPP superfamily phosphohydrolase
VSPCVATLAKLEARYGVFACLGNHDSFAGVADELAYLLGKNGISTLRNDATTIQIHDTEIEILGIEDLGTGRPDLRRALRTAEKHPGEVKVLLSHRPEIFPVAARQGIDLVLSGHYHGGQVKLLSDRLSIARFLTPYAEGLYRLPRGTETEKKGANLFVSRGVGVSGLPIRLNCPPQIAHLTLRKA